MPRFQCILFVPGSRPELLSKAMATASDRVCMDLEDAVAPGSKADARAVAVETLSDRGVDPARLVVRVNHPGSTAGRADLDAIASLPLASVTLMVPKVATPQELDDVRKRLGRQVRPQLIPVVETVRGLANVEAIACAEGVVALLFGGLDLSVELGASLEWEPLLYARSRTVHAARLAGVAAVDMPFFDTRDADALSAEADRARRLGFSGKAAIHPRQVETIGAVFVPSESEVVHALRLVEAYEREQVGAFLLDGVMVDRPAVEAARRLLERATTGGPAPGEDECATS